MLKFLKAHIILVTLILLLLAAVWTVDTSPSFQSCINHTDNEKSEQPLKQCFAVIPITFGDYKACVGSWVDGNNPSITALATIIIAFFTATLWGIACKQDDTTRAVQRAYITSKGMKNLIQRDVIHFLHQWENSGTTPTRNMTSRINWRRRDTPLPIDFAFEDVEGGVEQLIVMGPKATADMMVGERLLRSELGDFFDEHQFFYVWGWTKYNDIFDQRKQHITKFCYKLTIGTLTFDNATGEIQAAAIGWETYSKNNCSDEECNRD